MQLYTKQEAIARMNHFGEAGKPFLFGVDYRQEKVFVAPPHEVDPHQVRYNLNGFTNHASTPRPPLPAQIEWQPTPISADDYAQSFRQVHRHIRAGNSYLANLTAETPIRTNLTAEQIYHHAEAPYKLWWRDGFLFFSPEIFVRMEGNHISSYPMKGTIDASLPNAQNLLLNNPKEMAEQATIVDLIRNDLSRIATQVCVPRYGYIDQVHTHGGTLLQMSSEVRGTLPRQWQAQVGTLLFRLLPAGSITGAPKQKTMQIIAEAEQHNRGFYTGVAGYFDGTKLDSAVMIRFIQERDSALYFKSGGGITAQSRQEEEYHELIQKVYVPIY